MMTSNAYATLKATGAAISPPEGWVILPEGRFVPNVHREYIENYGGGWHGWAEPRRCRSTMTATHARVWGGVRAYAVLEAKEP